MFQLIVTVLLCAAGLAAGAASAYYFLRARRQEAAAPDPTDTVVEMRALGQRIETLVGQQQLQGETARHQMAQKMEAVVESVTQQRTHVAGLQSELRHEVRRRDAEMDEIRHQLTSIQQMATRTALPAAPAAALPPVEPTPVQAEPVQAEPVFAAPPLAAEPPAASPPDAFEIAAFEPLAAAAPVATFEPTGDGFAASFSDGGWDVGVTPAATQTAEDARPFADPFALDPPPAQTPPFDGAPGVTFEDLTPEETPAPVPAFETPAFETPAFETPAFETPAFGSSAFTAPAVEVPAFAPMTFQPAGFSAPAFSPAAPAAPAVSAPPSETAWVARADRPEPTASLPTFDVPTFGVPTFDVPSFDAPAAEAPAPPAVDPAAPFVAPAGADRLTVIASIDELTQQALYMAGVTTLDEIARWGRTDARRISSTVSVSEDTILNQWVFEAQAALFQSFSSAQR